jgi:hypothetical protein
MSLIKDTWGQLVRHRLWPIALGLVAAMVAVPMLLSKDPAPAPAPAPTTASASAASADDAALEPVVARADATAPTRRRHVLGDRKDPFKPAPTKKAKVTKVEQSTTTGGPGVAGADKPSTGGTTAGGGSSSGGGATSTPVSTGTTGGGSSAPAAKPARTYPADSLTVRFGAGDDPKQVLVPGKELPEATDDDTNPLLVYLGLSKDGKQAIFLLDASVKADGDGRCESDGSTGCETLRMRAGDTEFLDVLDAEGKVAGQFELDVLAIHTKKGAKAATARKARASKTQRVWAAKARTSLAGAARAGGSANLGAGVGALLGSL